MGSPFGFMGVKRINYFRDGITTKFMTITITQLYQALADKFGKTEAENLTTYIEEKIKSETGGLATKADVAKATAKLTALVYTVAIIQTLTIVGSLIGIMFVIISHTNPQ